MKKFVWIITLAVAVGSFGCKRQQATGNQASTGQTVAYSLRGTVISTDPARGEVTLDHEAVPGFMEAMTMPYTLKDPGTIGELHPGDKITARLQVEKDSDGVYHHARLDQIVVIAQARPDYKPATQYHVPTKNDLVPDFALTNQSGKSIHLKQYRGKALLITFIYTRCPLGDFCPRMSRNFAEIEETLRGDKALLDHTHLLSISFDPAYDSPSVLRSYGGAYTGRYTKENFDHWEFAAPPTKDPKDLSAMEQYFNIGVTPGDSKTLNHSLSTVLMAPDGRIFNWYPGNDWKPSDVVADIRVATKGM